MVTGGKEFTTAVAEEHPAAGVGRTIELSNGLVSRKFRLFVFSFVQRIERMHQECDSRVGLVLHTRKCSCAALAGVAQLAATHVHWWNRLTLLQYALKCGQKAYLSSNVY